MRLTRFVVATIFPLTLSGCHGTVDPSAPFTFDATVFRGVESGCRVLRARDRSYDPRQIDPALLVVGARLRVTAIHHDQPTTCMDGEVIVVLRAERLP